MLGKLSMLGAVAVLAMGFVAVTAVSHAQYPTPGESVTIEASDTTVNAGGTTTLTCNVTDDDGDPAANSVCTFSIVSEPGGPSGDAALGSKTVTKVTNAQGVATASLFVGSTPGILVVEAESGDAVSSVLITVEGGGTSTVPAPPQSPIGGTIQPPSTGSGGLAH